MIKQYNILSKKSIKSAVCTAAILIALLIIITLNILCCPKQNAFADTKEELLKQVHQAEQMYVAAQIEIREAQEKEVECQSIIDQANELIPVYQNELNKRTVMMYKDKIGSEGFFSSLFQIENLNDLVKNLEYFKRLNDSTNDLLKKYVELYNKSVEARDEIWQATVTAESKAKEAENLIVSTKSAVAQLETVNIHITLPEPQEEQYNPGGGGGYTPIPGPSPHPTPDPFPDKNTIVDRALSCLGKYYEWGAAGPDVYDCSGLVSYAYTGCHIHYWYTGSIRDSAGNGVCGWYATEHPTNGTCCCSNTHCGIYYNGQMIHAPDFGQVVSIGPIDPDMSFYNR